MADRGAVEQREQWVKGPMLVFETMIAMPCDRHARAATMADFLFVLN